MCLNPLTHVQPESARESMQQQKIASVVDDHDSKHIFNFVHAESVGFG